MSEPSEQDSDNGGKPDRKGPESILRTLLMIFVIGAFPIIGILIVMNVKQLKDNWNASNSNQTQSDNATTESVEAVEP